MALALTGEQGAASAQQPGSFRSRLTKRVHNGGRAGGSDSLGVPDLQLLTSLRGWHSTNTAPLLPRGCRQHLKGGKSGGNCQGSKRLKPPCPRAARLAPEPCSQGAHGLLSPGLHQDASSRASRRDPAQRPPPAPAQAAPMQTCPNPPSAGVVPAQRQSRAPNAGGTAPGRCCVAGTCYQAGRCRHPSSPAAGSTVAMHRDR